MNSSLFEGCWKVSAVFPKGNAQFCTLFEKCLKVVGNLFALVLHWPHQNAFQQNWFHAGIYIYQLEPDLLETFAAAPSMDNGVSQASGTRLQTLFEGFAPTA